MCTLLTLFTYPLDEEFARNGKVEVVVTLEACGDNLKITETYEALGQQLGDRRITEYPFPRHSDPSPEPDPVQPVVPPG